MNKICKICQSLIQPSIVASAILQQLNIPKANLCDRCSMRRLMAIRNERRLYQSTCHLCHKSTLSMYAPNLSYIVYCHDCWWSDRWEATDFGLPYSGPATFFDQLQQLQLRIPREALVNLNSENCDYCNHIRDSKDCYMSNLIANQCERNYYCYWMVKTQDAADCYYVLNSERMYGCVACIQSYNCSFVLEGNNCLDCHYCYDIRGCSNCMFSSNLRNKSYVFANKQLTQVEYEKKIQEIKLGSWRASQTYRQQWQTVIRDAIHQHSNQIHCEASTGDNLQNCVSAELAWNSYDDEYLYNAASIISGKHVVNGFAVGTQPVEWGTNLAVVKGGTTIVSCYNTAFSSNIYFCENMISSSDCIGSIGLQKKQYCILNTPYPKDQYERIKHELLVYLSSVGILGEFFPESFSTFAYNETAAQDFYPLTSEQAEALGYRWQNQLPGTFGRKTLNGAAIPDKIEEVVDDITRQIICCKTCGRNYKIIQVELELYRHLQIAVPRECPDCRLQFRIRIMGERNLYHKQCNCAITNHDHGERTCSHTFMTKYSPNNSEKVYCQTCYQKEIY